MLMFLPPSKRVFLIVLLPVGRDSIEKDIHISRTLLGIVGSLLGFPPWIALDPGDGVALAN